MNLSTATAQVAPDSGSAHHHDTHALPPAFIQKAHWHYASVKKAELDLDEDVIDFRRGLTAQQKNALRLISNMSAPQVEKACRAYKEDYLGSEEDVQGVEEVRIFEHTDFPGKMSNSSVRASTKFCSRPSNTSRSSAARNSSHVHVSNSPS
jgi:hypothetical protein